MKNLAWKLVPGPFFIDNITDSENLLFAQSILGTYGG